MSEFFSGSSFFCVALTLITFCIADAAQKKWKLAILNPIMVSAIMVILVLFVLDIPNEVYQSGCQVLSYLLTPATICLSISFYSQFQALKKHLPCMAVGVLAGTICSLGSVYLLCTVFGLDRALLLSLMPKSVTTAIGVALSEEVGGISAVTTAAIVVTGTFGNIAGPWLCKIFRIKNEIAQGVAFGTASHVVGTAKAAELSQMAGAVSSLALTIAGLATAVLLSFLTQYI